MKTIAYLMYGGRRDYHLELTYSVLSAHHFLRKEADNIQIVLITDSSNRRDDLPVDHIIVGDADLDRWMLGGKYTHAAKYQALISAMDECKGKVLLVDTDTYFTQHPKILFDRIGERQSLMCDYDTPLGEHGEWAELLAKLSGPVVGYTVNANSPMFNSGAIGVDWSFRTRIGEVYDLMTGLYTIDPVFNVEQFAFSAVLAKYTSISVCADALRHYWGFDRRFVHAQIDDIFPEFSRDVFERNVGNLRALGMPAKSLPDRIRARGKRLMRGNNPQYGFAYLSYLCALSSATPKMADAWANTALDALVSKAVVWRNGSRAHVRRDFRKFAAERLDAHLWMRPETRQRWRQYWGDLELADRGE